jgi:hypothetical protein
MHAPAAWIKCIIFLTSKNDSIFYMHWLFLCINLQKAYIQLLYMSIDVSQNLWYIFLVRLLIYLWRQTLELKYFRFSRTKTEYTRCQFSGDNSDDEDVSLGRQVYLWMIYFDIWDQYCRVTEGSVKI